MLAERGAKVVVRARGLDRLEALAACIADAGGEAAYAPTVNINDLAYFDFTGDSIDEAVVVASTCATGTAGPDIHSVFTRQPDGSLAELKIHAPSENRGDLLGRVFYNLNVKDGLLVQTFQDTSGRKDPLVIKFRWNGRDKEFQAVEVQSAKRYRTSFDRANAKTEVEKAVCDLSDVAFLDLRVDEMYRG